MCVLGQGKTLQTCLSEAIVFVSSVSFVVWIVEINSQFINSFLQLSNLILRLLLAGGLFVNWSVNEFGGVLALFDHTIGVIHVGLELWNPLPRQLVHQSHESLFVGYQ